jgi:hypothetical protein
MRPKRQTASFHLKRICLVALRRVAGRNDLNRSKQLEKVIEQNPEIAKELALIEGQKKS